MKVHRFITEYEVKDKQVTITDADVIHQWKNVLKFKKGEHIELSSTGGMQALCELSYVDKNEAVLSVIEEYENKNKLEKDATLYMAILKRENFELVAQKATELGITTIVPILTDRTIKQNLNFERLNKIVKEASELCGRSSIPEIKDIMKFEDAIGDSKNSKTQIFFDSTGTPLPRSDLGKTEIDSMSISLFIGPEGGWTEKEINLAKENNLPIISVSPLTLRGETAAIVAVYLGMNL